ncbi:hypothetical protein SAMN04487969_109149 [Paenibacillus algorifonticola]|uniref:FlxA-like protein n=1 Tax=Paenibacillus algorifonticola TaxID=684063 RepID=A0A1I2EJE4_9BACL|nr:hypothetical protein [Paenibacillus algorifonticola]SFE92757.1 hypothetical protein SAMN04487969_109149 [Paenibacillus algorifonticola]
MKQKARLNEEMQSVKTNEKLDTKLKMERVKALTASISQIDAQISQIHSEEIQEKTKIGASKDDQPKKSTSDNPEKNMDQAVKNSMTYDHLGKLAGVREKLQGSNVTMESGIRFDRMVIESNPHNDAGKSAMLENAEQTVFKLKREIMTKTTRQIHAVDQKMNELVNDLNTTDDSSSESDPKSVGGTGLAGSVANSDKVREHNSRQTEEDPQVSAQKAKVQSSAAMQSIDIRV